MSPPDPHRVSSGYETPGGKLLLKQRDLPEFLGFARTLDASFYAGHGLLNPVAQPHVRRWPPLISHVGTTFTTFFWTSPAEHSLFIESFASHERKCVCQQLARLWIVHLTHCAQWCIYLYTCIYIQHAYIYTCIHLYTWIRIIIRIYRVPLIPESPCWGSRIRAMFA